MAAIVLKRPGAFPATHAVRPGPPPCRLCGCLELHSFLDLGATPPCELFLTAAAIEAPELTYPLHVRLCARCLHVQLQFMIEPEQTFTEYASYSSFSTSWTAHARRDG